MQRLTDSPTGRLVPIRDGQQAFIPNPLPRDLHMSPRIVSLLVDAASAVGTLRGVGETVPNPRLLIRQFIRREVVLSSRIEGTIASLSDVFAYEVEDQSPPGSDVAEVVNYVTALEYGIDNLKTLPSLVSAGQRDPRAAPRGGTRPRQASRTVPRGPRRPSLDRCTRVGDP